MPDAKGKKHFINPSQKGRRCENMEYSKEPISENKLRQAVTQMDGELALIFIKGKDGQCFHGVVRDIFSEKFSLLWFIPNRKVVRYKNVVEWIVPTKMKLAEEVLRLRSILEEYGIEDS
jgi:hypothetical protein